MIRISLVASLGTAWYLGQSIVNWAQSIFLIAGIVSISTALFHVPIVKSSILRISHRYLSPLATQITFITCIVTVVIKTSIVQTLSTVVVGGVMWPISLLSTGWGFLLTIPYMSVLYLGVCAGLLFSTLLAIPEFSPVSTPADKAIPLLKPLLPGIIFALALIQVIWFVFGLGDHLVAGYVAAIVVAIGIRVIGSIRSRLPSAQNHTDILLSALPLEYMEFILFIATALYLSHAFPIPPQFSLVFPFLATFLFYRISVHQPYPYPARS